MPFVDNYTVYGMYRGQLLVYVGVTRQPGIRKKNRERVFKGTTFRPLVICDRPYAIWLEKELIARWQPLENVYAGGTPGPPEGTIRSAETRRKIGNAHLGKTLSVKHRQQISEFQTGRKHSVETRRKISEAQTGRKLSAKHRRNLSIAQKKRPARGGLTLTHRQQISETLTGRTFTVEHRQNISEAQTGRKHSAETRRKMSIAQKKRWENG